MTSRLKSLWCAASVALLAFAGGQRAAAAEDNREVYFSADFNSGTMPEGVGVFDLDGQPQAVTSIQLGFPKTGSSWIVRRESTEVRFAASSSRHKVAAGAQPVAANDWMVLPEIWIKGAKATLKWFGRSVNEQSKSESSYRVLLSTKGGTPDDFADAAVVAEVENESMDKWVYHYASLAQWEGQRVWIAFVNTSLQKELLGIDDISVEGEKGIAEIIPYPGEYLNTNGQVEFGGTLIPRTDTPVTSLKVKCETSGVVMEKEFTGLNVKKGEQFEFRMDQTVAASYGDVVTYTLTAEVNGVAYDPMTRTTRVLAFVPKKKVVVEERTGMWCGYCPRGTVAMKTLQKNYPDQFIGIAIHADEDPLALNAYANGVGFPDGAPTAWIDRTVYDKDMMTRYMGPGGFIYTTLNGGIETKFQEHLAASMPMGEVSVSAELVNGKINMTTSTRFAVGEENAAYRLALVITEDHVWKPGYYQVNYFANSGESLEGYENLPKAITENYEFNHVARVIYDAWNGIPNSIPASIAAGEEYTYTRTVAKPMAILNPANVHIVAMIIDTRTGAIVNGDSVPLVKSGIEGVGADSTGSPLISATPQGVKAIAAAPGEAIQLTVCNLSGAVVARAQGIGEAQALLGTMQGVFVVSAQSSTGSSTLKITR